MLRNSIFDFWQLDPAGREAFDVAYDNIYAFHVAQKPAERIVENMKVCNAAALVCSLYLIF